MLSNVQVIPHNQFLLYQITVSGQDKKSHSSSEEEVMKQGEGGLESDYQIKVTFRVYRSHILCSILDIML